MKFDLNLDPNSTRFFLEYKILRKTEKFVMHFLRIRDLEGAEGGTSRNERRIGFSEVEGYLLSEVRRSTEAKRTPEKARPRAKRGGMPKIVNSE